MVIVTRVRSDGFSKSRPTCRPFSACAVGAFNPLTRSRFSFAADSSVFGQGSDAVGKKPTFTFPAVFTGVIAVRVTDDPANRPMFIHCTAAIRVGGFWLIRRVMRDGMTFEAALEEARKVGLTQGPHLEEFAREYIRTHKK